MTTYAELRTSEFAFGANCIPPANLAGGFVEGALNATRQVVSAETLHRAYHELDDVITDREAYGTVYQYPPTEYGAHVRRVGSPKGYTGPAACCRLPWDIDRSNDLGAALADAKKLATYLLDRYGTHAANGLGAYFSGAKGFHLSLVAMSGFHPFAHVPAVVKLLCLTLARKAGVTVDSAIYDHQRLFRLPNTRHPRTGLYKRFFDLDELFRLNADAIREVARHPAGFAVPSVSEDCTLLADDWCEAESLVLRAAPSRLLGTAQRAAPSSCPVVPKFVGDFIGFGDLLHPSRAVTLFQVSAALSQAFHIHGPDAVVRGLLEEVALKTGLGATEVEKQLAAGIEHGKRQTKERAS